MDSNKHMEVVAPERSIIMGQDYTDQQYSPIKVREWVMNACRASFNEAF
jgi:hypothetical protein